MKSIYIVFFISLSVTAWSQKNVSGRVTDAESGEAIIGATVLVDGTTKGTITDFDGNYNLSLAENENRLVFSFVGYEKEMVDVGNKSILNVSLNFDSKLMSEVVVVGYGVQKKENLTGAIENIQLDDVENRAITNSGQILQGKVSGVQITQNSGQPGEDGVTIRIRGVSSINNNNDPLVIIDGVQGSLQDINPNDIATMTVLKDASAAAIYGARASAGVILIKTKEQKSELRISYNGTFSFQDGTALPNTVNSATYAERYNEARVNTGFPERFSDEDIERYRAGDDPRFPNTDWYDLMFDEGAFMQNHYLTIGGGQENYNFTISAGHLDQDGILLGTSSEKLTYRTRFNSKFFENKFRINAMLTGYNKMDDELSSSTPSVLSSLALRSPLAIFRAVDSTGVEGLYGGGAQYFAFQEAGGGITRKTDNLKYQVELEVEPIEGLIGSLLYSRNTTHLDYERLVPSVSLAGNVFDDVGSITRSQLSSILTNNVTDQTSLTIRYSKTLNKHNINILIGGERLKQSYEDMRAEIYDLSANQPVFSLGDPSTYYLTGSAKARALLSSFGRINYNFDDKYLFEANIRRDGSSRFTKGSQYGVFPSFSVGWRIDKESFFENELISDLKLRASWGLLGNEFIGDYYPQYSKLTPNQNYSFGGTIVPGTAITELAANNVTWEKVQQLNLGLDMTIRDRFDLLVNYFEKRTYDNLIAITVPKSLGINVDPFQNIGEMQNKGLELSMEYRSDPAKKFIYSANLNGAYIVNEVTDLGFVDFVNHSDFITGYAPDPTTIRSVVGQPFANYYGYIADGIYQIDDFIWQDESNPEIAHDERNYQLKESMPDPSGLFATPAPGDIKFRDVDENGVLTAEDKQIIGNSQPKLTYSFTFNASYSNFDISLLAQGVGNTDAYLTGGLIAPFWNGSGNISQDLADNRWTFENQSTEYQRLHVDAQRSNIISSYYIQNAAYLRLKNIQVGYKVPEELISKMSLSSLRFFASIENILTITKFKGFDPERAFNKITGDFHPLMRVYSFGVQARF